MKSLFEHLLECVAKEHEVTLHLNGAQRCGLLINGELHVVVEVTPSASEILMAVFLGEVAPGKYRETVLKEALKSNGDFPISGVLGFCSKKHSLALHQFLPLENLNEEKFLAAFNRFIEKALQWKQSIMDNRFPELSPERS